MGMDMMRGLLGGIASGADEYSDILDQEKKTKYEDERANILFQRQQSMEALRNKNSMNVAEFQAGKASELSAQGHTQGMAADANKMRLQTEAGVAEQAAMKRADIAQKVTDINAQVETGQLTQEMADFQTGLLEAGVSPSLVLRQPGKALTPEELNDLAKTGETLFPEDTEKARNWVRATQSKLEKGSGGSLSAKKEGDINFDDAHIGVITDIEGMSKAELIAYKKRVEPSLTQKGFTDILTTIDKKIVEAGGVEDVAPTGILGSKAPAIRKAAGGPNVEYSDSPDFDFKGALKKFTTVPTN